MMYNMEVFSHRILTYCFVKVNLGLDFLHFSLPLLCLRISLKYCQAGMDFITALTKHEKSLSFSFGFLLSGLNETGMERQ